MNRPEPVFIGYFPKKTAKPDDWFGDTAVEEICSVSCCISRGPANWIDKWKHNDWWLYDTEEAAWSVIDDDRKEYDLYAYRIFPTLVEGAKEESVEVKPTAQGDLSGYQFLGYDVVSRFGNSAFECSPLSCNRGFDQYRVNQYCLIGDLEDAWRICREMAAEAEGRKSWEPGPYHLVAVYRRPKNTSGSPADGA